MEEEEEEDEDGKDFKHVSTDDDFDLKKKVLKKFYRTQKSYTLT